MKPDLVARIAQPTVPPEDRQEVLQRSIARIDAALKELDGSLCSTVRFLTGLTKEQIDELGGLPE